MITLETHSQEETYNIALKLANTLTGGEVITLDGDLGAGKTVFSKGIAKGLGIEEPVTSPTFIIMQEYLEGRIPLYHFDVYRIEDPFELEAIGGDEYLRGDGVCLVEWSVQIEDLIPEDAIRININRDPDKGFDYRIMTIEGLKPEVEEMLKQ